MEDEDVEEGVQEQNDVRFDRNAIQQYRLWCHVERVRHERGLDHDERVVHVLLVQHMPTDTIISLATTERDGMGRAGE